MILDFPNPELSTPEGIVLAGGTPSAENLQRAYAKGIFPWPHEGAPLLWFSPPERGVLDFKDLHLPRSFRKVLRKNAFEVRWNTCFGEVIKACAEAPRSGESGTWITPQMQAGYLQAHRQGWAHSVEIFLAGELVGGLYGVALDRYFSAESMFFKVSPASKVAFIFLILALKQSGSHWVDVQMITPVTEAFGGRYIDRSVFLKRLQDGPPLELKPLRPRSGQLTEEELTWIENH